MSSSRFSMKSIIARLVLNTPVYQPSRKIYQMLFHREAWDQWKRRKTFYRQFVRQGDLVFDVGANVGEYALTFLSLGASVVCVEPNPNCLEALSRIRPRGRMSIEAVAIGGAHGTGTLKFGKESALSSMSDEWIHTAENACRFKNQRCIWDSGVQVEISTLDQLMAKYGEPQFVKLDVEGYEKEALSGLSRLPKQLSFEFNSEWLENTRECLGLPLFSQESTEFNLVVGQPDHLQLETWVSRDCVLQKLAWLKEDCFGDIMVRRKG